MAYKSKTSPLLSVQGIAQHFGLPVRKVIYAIRQHNIPARAKIGTNFAYSRAQLPDIDAALKATQRRRPESWELPR